MINVSIVNVLSYQFRFKPNPDPTLMNWLYLEQQSLARPSAQLLNILPLRSYFKSCTSLKFWASHPIAAIPWGFLPLAILSQIFPECFLGLSYIRMIYWNWRG